MISSLVFLLITLCCCSAKPSALDVLWSMLTYRPFDTNKLQRIACSFGHNGACRYMFYCNESDPTSGSYNAFICATSITIESIALSLLTTD